MSFSILLWSSQAWGERKGVGRGKERESMNENEMGVMSPYVQSLIWEQMIEWVTLETVVANFRPYGGQGWQMLAWVRSQREWEINDWKSYHAVVYVVYMLRWVADLEDYGETWAISDGVWLFRPSKSTCHIDLLLIYGNLIYNTLQQLRKFYNPKGSLLWH